MPLKTMPMTQLEMHTVTLGEHIDE